MDLMVQDPGEHQDYTWQCSGNHIMLRIGFRDLIHFRCMLLLEPYLLLKTIFNLFFYFIPLLFVPLKVTTSFYSAR